MAGEGLLGFIKGVSGTLEEEYKRQNLEAEDIRKESRAEERAIAAEKRRILAEKQVAEYHKKLDLEYRPKELGVEADFARGLIEKGTHPELLLKEAGAEQEMRRINAGKDPTTAREEYRDLSKAGRIRAGVDEETARVQSGTGADKVRAEEAARLEAQREDDEIRRDKNLRPRGSRKVDVSFTVSEATSQLKSDLSVLHDIDLPTIRARVSDPMKGGSRLTDLRNGDDTLAAVLSSADSRKQLQEEIALKLHNTEEKRLKEAANSKQVTSLDEVTKVSNLIAERAEQTISALDYAQKQIAGGSDTTQELTLLRQGLAAAYGESEEESKQSPAFRSMFAAFKASLAKKK